MEPWIQIYSGKKFWPLSPDPNDVDIKDIAHALALKCRFTGHCKKFYSIAEHSVWVSRIVSCLNDGASPVSVAKWALLHDASEAYLPDVASPIKAHIQGFQQIEDRVSLAIAKAFSLPFPPTSYIIKEADSIMLDVERKQAMVEGPAWNRVCKKANPIVGIKLQYWYPKKAEKEFLKECERLGII